MNKTELISQIAESADISKKAAGDALQAFMATVTNTMEKGDKLQQEKTIEEFLHSCEGINVVF